MSDAVSSVHPRTKDVKTILLQPWYILEKHSLNQDLNPLTPVHIGSMTMGVSALQD